MNKLQQKHKEVIAASNLYAEDRINAATVITLEFAKEFVKWIDEEQIPYENGLWVKYFDGKDNYLDTQELLTKYIETL
tara:strand:+ start:163 stop:396 length:234 start_codon:yes stop_codon:yes gene_type:complete